MKPLRSKRMERTFVVEIQPNGARTRWLRSASLRSAVIRVPWVHFSAIASEAVKLPREPVVEDVRFGVACLAAGPHAVGCHCDGIGARL